MNDEIVDFILISEIVILFPLYLQWFTLMLTLYQICLRAYDAQELLGQYIWALLVDTKNGDDVKKI